MKRFITLCLILLTLCIQLFGCTENKDYYEYEFVNISWTRNAENDTEYIYFSDDGSFSYYCACGNPVNDADLCEGYTYNPDTNIIWLEYFEKNKETISKIKVMECTEDTLTLDFEGDIRIFIREETEEEYIEPDTVDYQGRTYIYLECNADIFYYDLNLNTYLEEDIIHPIPNENWDVIYYNGDLFILDNQVEKARAYYGDDANYKWSVEIESKDLEDISIYPLSISAEDLTYIYGYEDSVKDETLSFDCIEKFGMLKKTSIDGLVCGSTSLAFYDGVWYWRSEIIDDSQDGWPEYVYRLPKDLNDQIINLSKDDTNIQK